MFKLLTTALALLVLLCFNAKAQVTFTPVTDQTCTNLGTITLSDIVISEFATTDFNISSTSKIIVLTATSGSFFTGAETVTFSSGGVSAAISVGGSDITITLSDPGLGSQTSTDILTISGVQFSGGSTPGTINIQVNAASTTPVNGLNVNDIVASVNVKDNPDPTITGVFDICKGTTHTYITEAGNSNYLWVYAGGTVVGGGTSTDNTIDMNWPSGIEGNIRVSYTRPNGCTTNEKLEYVYFHDYPTGTNATPLMCSGIKPKVMLQSSIINGVTSTFEWSAADNPNTTGESLSIQTVVSIEDIIINSTLAPENVVYTVTPTSAVGGCAGASFTVTMTVDPAPDVIITNNKPIIPNGGMTDITLTSSLGGTTFSFIAAYPPEISGALDNSGSSIAQTLDNSGNLAQQVTYTITPDHSGCTGTPLPAKVTVNGVPSVITADSIALVSFYNSTNGPGWLSAANWLTGAVSTWEGITVTGNRVTDIVLNNHNLTGIIPSSIGNLSALINLTLDGNVITSPLPASLGTLTALNFLELGFNSFSEPFPVSIVNLTSLLHLRLEGNNFTGVLPSSIGNLNALIILELSQNQLSGAIPIEVGNITGIQTLDLSANLFTGSVPIEIGTLAGLQFLKLHDNQLSGPIPSSFSALINLQECYLNNNTLTGPIPSIIGNLLALTYLDLSNNLLTGTLPTELGNLVGLQNLFLQQNNFSGIVPGSITALSGLLSCDLSQNKFTSIPNLASLPLTSLDVSKNKLTFGSLEPNIGIPSFTYAPQDSVGVKKDTVIQTATPFTLASSVSGASNQYQWKKDAVTIGGATSSTLILPSPVFADEGSYAFEVTNSVVTGLTLISRPVNIKVSSLKRDSLALVQLFNSTAGNSWTNKTGWLSANLTAWSGVTITSNRVTDVNLSNNNLNGSVPIQITEMLSLKTVNVSTNKISIIPQLTPLTQLTAVNVSGNKLDFSSLEPNVSLLPIMTYSNQADIGTIKKDSVTSGSAYLLTATAGGNNNIYQWKKNNVIVPAATASTYNIASIGRSNMGQYVCEITNSIIPGLTIKSAPQTVLAVADLSGKLLTAANVPATKGSVRLFRVTSSNGYDTIATKKIDVSGAYKFSKVVLDDYQILGYADTITHAGALPTYYKKTIFWEEADTLFVNGLLTSLDIISAFKPSTAPGGKGEISGIVEQDDAISGGRTKAPKRVGGAGASVRRVENNGRGKEEILTLVAYIYTNENGEFDFTNLPTGNYRLNIQYPGYPMDDKSFVTVPIGTGLQSQVQVEALVAKGKITVRQRVITDISKVEKYTMEIYPNPSKDYIKIKFASLSSSRNIYLRDNLGREITNVPANSAEISVDVRAFKKGNYLLSIGEQGVIVKSVHIVVE